MAVWIELRCERRGGDMDRPSEMYCWSDQNNDPGELAYESVNGIREAYFNIKKDALDAGWKLVRGEGWVCPCCLLYSRQENQT